MSKRSEAATPPEVLKRLLTVATEEVLIGGQALAVWLDHYGLTLPAGAPSAISNDVDFLARSAAAASRVHAFAKAIGGKVHLPNERALTALVGQAYLDISDEEYLNVDVMFKLVGLTADEVRRETVKFDVDGMSFLVMHPLHVLRSRLVNLHKLPEKQNDKGELQLVLAIAVAREFLRRAVLTEALEDVATGRSPIQRYVNDVVVMARGDAGKKVAKRLGIRVADAIDPSLIPAGPFWDKAWPRIRPLMSPEWASQFSVPE
ncbi:hypothetical protein ACG00Y_18875 [Roseateles sp. LYH14W]|uniref:Uncharacterized protein n=1 Tax=Pelomonas parva TaxID=3299032 RepID=A0ABW7F5T4_9BURK